MSVGLVSRKLAERATYFEIILIFLGRRHRHRSSPLLGRRPEHVGADGKHVLLHRGAAAGVADHRGDQPLSADRGASGVPNTGSPTPMSSGRRSGISWGAGVFGGGTLNAPLVNYYEHGTFLTLNHAHTALFGRLRGARDRPDLFLPALCRRRSTGVRGKAGTVGVLALQQRPGALDFLNFFPIGWPHSTPSMSRGWPTRAAGPFYDTTLFWQWMRLPGDVAFALGALLMAWDFIIKATTALSARRGSPDLPGRRSRRCPSRRNDDDQSALPTCGGRDRVR